MPPLRFSGFAHLHGPEEPALLEPLSNERIADLVNPTLPPDRQMTAQRLQKSTGFSMRYILARGKTPHDLAYRVTDKFQQMTGVQNQDIGALALVHTDYSGEATTALAREVAERIGIARERVVAKALGCTGFAGILPDAQSLGSDIPEGKHCLILTVETPDRSIDARDSRATPIFATGAAATSLYKGDGHELLFAETEDFVPEGAPPGRPIFSIHEEKDVQDFWGAKHARNVVRMDGDLAYQYGSTTIEKAAMDSLERALSMGHEGKPVIVVPHQPNGRMIAALKKYGGPAMEATFAGRVPKAIFVDGMEGMGNTIASTIPHVLARIHTLVNADLLGQEALILIPSAGICIADPEMKMSVGRGAFVWNPHVRP